jgi:hypothetical protein
MDGRDKRNAHALDPEKPVGEALVVVNNIKNVLAPSQVGIGTEAEGKRFRKPPGRHPGPFKNIDGGPELMELGYSERIFRVVEVEAWNPMEGYILVHTGIGWAGQDMDIVSEILEGTADPLNVNTLPSTGGVSSIRKQADLPGFAVPVSTSCAIVTFHGFPTDRPQSGQLPIRTGKACTLGRLAKTSRESIGWKKGRSV